MDASPAVVGQAVTVPPAVRTAFEGVTSIEARIAVSVAVLVVGVVVAWVIAPATIKRSTALLRQRLPERASETVETVADYVPTTISKLLLYVIQVGVLLLTGTALLAVWGLVGLAIDVLTLLGLSIPLLGKIAATAALALVAYIGADLLDESVDRFATGSDRITEHQEEIVLRVGHLGIIALVVAGGLTVWGVDLSGLLVGAGFLGIVVGLAARQTLGSLIAGFVLMFSRPFTIGDWVAIGGDEGIVTDITIVNTRMENFDGETIVIPNDRVSNQPITNRSERGHLRLSVDVGIDYGTEMDRAIEIAQATLDEVEHVVDAPPPQVIPKSFGDSAIVLELRFWIDRPMPPKKWQAVSAVVNAIKREFDDQGIKIPYPQRELSGRAETGGFRINDAVEPAGEVETEARNVEPDQTD